MMIPSLSLAGGYGILRPVTPGIGADAGPATVPNSWPSPVGTHQDTPGRGGSRPRTLSVSGCASVVALPPNNLRSGALPCLPGLPLCPAGGPVAACPGNAGPNPGKGLGMGQPGQRNLRSFAFGGAWA